MYDMSKVSKVKVPHTDNVGDLVARLALVLNQLCPHRIHGAHFLEVIRTQVQVLEPLHTHIQQHASVS